MLKNCYPQVETWKSKIEIKNIKQGNLLFGGGTIISLFFIIFIRLPQITPEEDNMYSIHPFIHQTYICLPLCQSISLSWPCVCILLRCSTFFFFASVFFSFLFKSVPHLPSLSAIFQNLHFKRNFFGGWGEGKQEIYKD